MESQKIDVLVVGGGVVGLTLALELQTAGRQVTLLEQGSPGRGCSFANAGWVTPCFAMPLPQPGLFWKSIKWLLDPKSPLRIKPVPSFLLIRWLLSFMGSMNRTKMEKSIAVLTDISKYSLDFYAALSNRHPGKLGFQKKGLLMVSGTDAGVAAAVEEMELMKARGVPGRMVNASEVLEMEPCFKPGVIKGGVYFPEEAHIEPYPTSLALAEEFKAKGGKILQSAEVYDFVLDGKRVREVHSTQGHFSPELVVLAAGTWSRPLAKKIGLNLPLLGGKGYSMSVHGIEKNGAELKPRQPIMIVDRKIAITPRESGFRVAGTMELVDQDFSISPVRLNAVFEGAAEHLYFKDDESPSDVWRGLRPCTPDGVPVISFSTKYSNLFHCCGHQMLGLQSAPGSARLAGDLILGRPPLTDPKAFAASRYGV